MQARKIGFKKSWQAKKKVIFQNPENPNLWGGGGKYTFHLTSISLFF